MLPDKDRLPPYSEEAEKGILGAALLDYRVMDVATDYKLKPEAFYVLAHRIIFQAFMDLSLQGSATDVITVCEHLDKNGKLDKIGGSVFLDRLIDSTPTAEHAEYYIKIVAEKWRLRSIITECRDTEQLCFNTSNPAEDILASHAGNLMQIEARHQQEEITWSETVRESMNSIERIMESDNKLTGFSTGFLNIDRAVLGLKAKELTIIAARPSQGKTSLAMNIAEYVASGKLDSEGTRRPVGVFSLEMGREQLALRMKCANAGIDNWKLMRGFIPQSDMGKLVSSAAFLSKLPLYVDDRAGLDVDQVSIKARRWKQKHGIQLLIVDYLQLMHCQRTARQGRQLEVSAISGQMKRISMELEIPVLAISQLSRKPEDRKDGKPILSDLRESGAIEQDADNVWLMHRPCKYEAHPEYEDKRLAIVSIAKQRNGPTGEARLNFRQEYTRFEDRVKSVEELEYEETM